MINDIFELREHVMLVEDIASADNFDDAVY